MYARRLLPGIAVEVPPPALPDALPRMDVALFAGFAERGPVHRPVAIDSVAAFGAVFGGDVTLAHDSAGGGRDAMAALAPAVRGFFSNGGTGAFIIRVARTEALERGWRGSAYRPDDVASTRRFTLPGVVAADGGPARIAASSLGSWADAMRVAVRVERSAGRPRLMLRTDLRGTSAIVGPFGLSPADPDSWWNERDDESHYADSAAVAQARSLVAPVGAPQVWMLGALGDTWSEAVSPDPDPRTPLERDGLSRFDAELFLDPALASASIATLSEAAARMRDIDGLQLHGLHGAFAVPGGADFAEPSMIAVPDAAQPGWSRRIEDPFVPPAPKPGEAPAAWRDHLGSCAVPADPPDLAAPDARRFLDCATRLLATPVFAPINPRQRPGAIDLRWSASDAGATYVLEEAGRADLSGAVEIWRGTDLTHRVGIAREGSYYYRLHAELDGNISAASVTGFRVEDSAWEVTPAAQFDPATLRTIHAALLRTCAAIGDQFALLSAPRHFRAADADGHVAALTAALPHNERRALSYGALYHPWLVTPMGGAADPLLIDAPPEGAVAGTFAQRARERGAWVAPANIAIDDIVALSPVIIDADREAFARARLNLVRRDARGFVSSDAMTLSTEPDWQEVNVRRLMSLLRRLSVRQGAAFVFEPNGDVVRRAIERIFGHALDDLARRGAFAGTGGSDSYRLTVDPTDSDRANGRLVIEIAVRPSSPLRFLTLVLAQAGERFTVAEER
ncbi:hypothetical protein M0208_11540 [Sphingomonas sp. SUN019]|uniref:hypothetical protein n=1 Tax=Sphingomonas sp. SUN019 TaxID=2937788 RepID=UPI002164DBD3|nr:hypothetical protein [Sphingomonas sp. SUN019]UVO51122.1 hypothetical protein M0208_11540 [Sphingomonas sp. SUN019]